MSAVVIFDWNGTIVDDTSKVYAAVCKVFRHHGAKPPTMKEYIEALVDAKGDYRRIYTSRSITVSSDDLNKIYIPTYREGLASVELVPGTQDTLEYLKQINCFVWLVTSQHEELVMPLLEKFGLAVLFDGCCYHCRDKAEAIRDVHRDFDYTEQCWYVGDMPSDVLCAQGAGVNSVAYVSEHVPESFFKSARPNLTITELSQLKRFVRAV